MSGLAGLRGNGDKAVQYIGELPLGEFRILRVRPEDLSGTGANISTGFVNRNFSPALLPRGGRGADKAGTRYIGQELENKQVLLISRSWR